MVIAVDVDGVCADLMTKWLCRYSTLSGDTLSPTQLTDWAIHEFVKPGWEEKIYDILNEPDLYVGVEPVQGALDGVRILREKGHRVIFVTSTVIAQNGKKRCWLAEHGFLLSASDYVEAHDKSLIRADVLIDDGIHNLENFPGIRILFNQPWNMQVENPFWVRAYGWQAVVEFCEMGEETICQEAQRLVGGARGKDYGHPFDDFSRTASIWSALTGYNFTPEQVGLCMIGVKLSRQTNAPKRDNLVDIAGYAQTVDMVLQEKEKREDEGEGNLDY